MSKVEESKMNGIYFTTMCNINDQTDDANPGIKEKIRQQIMLFKENKFDVIFYYAHPNGKYYRYINRMPFFRDHYNISDDDIIKSDFIYIRKPSAINMGLIDLLNKIKKLNPRLNVILEVPTYPYDNEIQGFVRMTLKLKDKYARKKLKNYVDIVLTYSLDKEIFGIRTLNISNGVDALKLSKAVKKYPYLNDEKVRFIACAKFNLWHGYDRVIEGLHQYLLRPEANKAIEIEMVGDGASEESYRLLVEKYGLNDYVKFYGKLQGEDLIKVYSICDIGLDSMGRHRSGVYYNSSLKGKEYCAYGLMIVSGVETELDSAVDFEYYYRIPADDSPVDFEKVLEFYNTKVGLNRELCKDRIMKYAVDHFSMDVVFQPVIDYVNSSRR